MRHVPAPLVPVLAVAAGVPSAVAPDSTAAHVTYSVAFALFVLLGWWRLRQLRGPVVPGYRFIVGALTVWFAGDLLFDALTWAFGEFGAISPSDVLWISGYPLIAIGLVRLTRVRTSGRLREGMIDAGAMATVTAWLFWQFLILPAAENEQLSLTVLVGAFYPFGDVLLFAAVAILVLAPGSKRGATPYLVAALTLTLVGDTLMSTLPALVPAVAASGQTDRFDGLLLVANSLFVAALMHRDADRPADPDEGREQRLHPARVVFLGIALLVMPTMASLFEVRTVVGRVSLIGSVLLLTTLILIRFAFVVREQERIKAMLAHQADHDQLTGLANRQALHARLERVLARPHDYGPVIFYVDLDGFKQVNDRHGHAAGDAVLIEFARRLRSTLRPSDVAARIGGDEFVVLAENIEDEAAASAFADRLRGLAALPVRRGEHTCTVGASVGVAAAGELPHPDTDLLLAAADTAMYADKQAARI